MSDQIKPFIFWIVCGVVLVIELAMFFLVSPSKVSGKKTLDAYAVTKNFNTQFASLKSGYDKRSENTEKLGNRMIPTEINPAVKKSIDDILAEFIVGDAWISTIAAERSNYETIHKDLKAELYTSSDMLTQHLGIGDNDYHGKQLQAPLWYSANYSQQVAELLVTLGKTGVLGTGDWDERFIKTNIAAKSLRDRFGFVTTDTDYPPAGQHTSLTKRFHIVESLALAIANAEGTVTRDPFLTQKVMTKDAEGKESETMVVEVPSPEEDLAIRKVFLESMQVADAPIAKSGGEGPFCWEVEIKMNGTPGALFAALQSLDALRKPIVVRLGAQWSLVPYTQKERLQTNLKDVQFALTTKVIVCDFSHFPKPVLASAGPGPE